MRPLRLEGLRAATTVAVWTSCLALRCAAQGTDAALEESLEGVEDFNNYYADLHPCPVACENQSPSNWTVYTSYNRLQQCDEPLLFDFALYNPVADPDTPTKLRVCTAGNADSTANALFNGTNPAIIQRDDTDSACNAARAAVQGSATFELTQSGVEPEEEKRSAVTKAIENLQAHFEAENTACSETVMFGYYQGVITGIYVGQSFGRATVPSAAKGLLEHIGSAGGLAATSAAQLCGNGRNAHHVLGLVVNTAGNITAVQNAVKGWNEAKCVTKFESKAELKDVKVWEDRTDLDPFPGEPSGNTTTSNSTIRTGKSELHARQSGTCRTTKVVSGDSCSSLAARCGISAADFTKYNPSPSLCSSLVPGQMVCCSSGSLPDIRPQPNADGTCATHLVVNEDSCFGLAASNGLTPNDIDRFNNGTTWGWYGCNRLLTGMYVCLSTGKPPMPYPISNAVCGPLKPGSKPPTGSQQLKDLNPCPLNACCNVWGQCGISGDFCTEEKSASGNPGTSGRQDGCVSSCGVDIRNGGSAPASFGRIGYYETWNFHRQCLYQHVENSNTDGTYTIIHWAFAEVNPSDWTVKIVDDFQQWEKFKKISAKKVISFGGWGYSTEPGTYDILRQGMSPANRDRFASNIAAFLNREGLDGVDLDWEYPGAIDIPGTPPGQVADGPNYLKFLTTMKSKLSPGQTISIAAPASFWYLKSFPIQKMAEQLDYIVYMTYDLHGQWDAGNRYAVDGCPTGNCVRSHVNLTETGYALAMITKAGVPTNKIYVGESSYGRSFKLEQAGCKGSMCKFLGGWLDSPAAVGRCTQEPGYISNAEIDEIIASYDPDPEVGTIQVETWHDGDSNSDMMIYDGTEWVAYMTDATKNTRRDLWKGHNFAGTIDWAVDLQSFTVDESTPISGNLPDDTEPYPPHLAACTGSYSTLEQVRDAGDIPSHCVAVYMAEILANTLKNSMATYDQLVADGYDKKFNTYADAVAKGGKKAVRDWMYKNGNTYFTCDVLEPIDCCDFCYAHATRVDQCKFCDNKYCNGWSTICDGPEVICEPPSTGYFTVSDGCPPDFSKRAGSEPPGGYYQTIYWNRFRPGKEAAFWEDLYMAVGIDKDNIQFEDVQFYDFCSPTTTPEDCKKMGWDFGFPVPHGYDREDVINPKDLVGNAYNNLKDIVKDLPTAVSQLRSQSYSGFGPDLVDALALPVFMIEEAVNNIKFISDTIDEMEEEKRKGIILAFLSALLFFVPIVGQVASTVASLATIGRIIAILGTVGQVAVDIYGVVDSKGNDPLAIFSVVLAPLAIFDIVKIASTASRARGMSSADIGKLGKNVLGKMDVVRKTNSVCSLRKRNVFPDGALPMSSLNAIPVMSQDF